MEKILFDNISENYQLDTSFGSLRIGYLFDKQVRNAILIETDSTKTYHLKIYKELNRKWNLVFNQDSIISYSKIIFRDFNFDGKKDLAISCDKSLGTSIFEIKLWLNISDNKTFKYVPNFEEIGTPTIDNLNKTILGFTSCCEFQEMSLNEYFWEKDKLVLRQKTEIETYNKKVKAIEKHFKPDNSEVSINEIKKKISLAEIDNIIKKYNDFKE